MPQVQSYFISDAVFEKVTEAKKLLEETHGENDTNAELMRLGALVVIGGYDVEPAPASEGTAPATKTTKKK